MSPFVGKVTLKSDQEIFTRREVQLIADELSQIFLKQMNELVKEKLMYQIISYISFIFGVIFLGLWIMK